MNSLDSMGTIEQGNLEAAIETFGERMSFFNKNFESKLTPENGIYGFAETIKDNGVVERLGTNQSGYRVKDYFASESQLLRRELLGDARNATTLYDDNGIGYLRTVMKLGDNQAGILSSKLAPNVTITKGNFTAVTDAYGRPVLNKITDLAIKDTPKDSLSAIPKGPEFRIGDHRGHIIADSLGGPSSQENIVAQVGNEVNQGKFARTENIVRNLKNQGHKVDYEVKTNYTDSQGRRPSSFEPKIMVDGAEYTKLPADLKKIYNETKEDLTPIKKFGIDAGEKFGIANEVGKKNALVAAGLTMTMSATENISAFVDGEISAEEMAVDIVKDTAIAGAVGYGTAFISTSVSQVMSKSSSALISKVGGSCLPAAVVEFGVGSYEDISDFAQGEIDGTELAYNLGENAAGVAGGFAGGALTGAAIGTVAGPVGTVAGSIVGGVVGCVIATEAYETAVEVGSECVDYLANQAQDLADNVINCVKETAPEVLGDVKDAFADFASNVTLPFSFG